MNADHSDPIRARRRAIGSALRAWARMVNSMNTYDEQSFDEYISALTELLAWTCSMDGLLNSESYKSRRDADPVGLILPGLRWVRNEQLKAIKAHAGAPASAGVAVFITPQPRLQPFITSQWLPLDANSPPPRNKAEGSQRAIYWSV
jgi:hypothetical protein